MKKSGGFTAVLALACLLPTASMAEYGGFFYTGCTKDNFKVKEQILWDCQGSCGADTPLKAAILREANDSMKIYPEVVSFYTKAQVAKFAHVPEIRERANIQATETRSRAPQFGGTCNPAENVLIRAFGTDDDQS